MGSSIRLSNPHNSRICSQDQATTCWGKHKVTILSVAAGVSVGLAIAAIVVFPLAAPIGLVALSIIGKIGIFGAGGLIGGGIAMLFRACIDKPRSRAYINKSRSRACIDKPHPDLPAIQQIRTSIEDGRIPSLDSLNQKYRQKYGVDPSFFSPPPTPILQGLYLGNQVDARVLPLRPGQTPNVEQIEDLRLAEEFLRRERITLVITCSGTNSVLEAYRLAEIRYENLIVHDSPNSPTFGTHREAILQLIHEERSRGGNVLIHCNAGASRSPSFVLAYLIGLGLTFDQSYRYVKDKRLLVGVGHFEADLQALNPGFMLERGSLDGGKSAEGLRNRT